ncbi:MAG: flippase [Halobacteriota archaeon]|nr:flippase [Halobacteriota archaeon]
MEEEKLNGAARGSAVLIASFVVGSIFRYLFNVGLGWLLSPEDFGILGVSLSFSTILSLFIGSGFPQTATKFLAEERGDKSKILKTSMFMNLIIGTTVGFIFYLLFESGLLGLGEKYGPIMLIVTITVIISSVDVVVRYSLQGLFMFKKVAYLNITEAVTRLLFGVGLVLFGFGVYGAITGILASGLFVLVLSIFFISDLKFWKERGWASLSIFKFATPMFVGMLSLSLLMQIDILGVKFLVAEDISDQLAGYYQSALVLARLPVWIITAVMSAVFPFISSYSTDNKESAKIYINKSLKYACLFLVPISVVFFLISTSLISLFFPEKYLPGAPALAIVSLGMAFLVIATIFARSFQALGEPNIPSFFLSLSVIIQLLLLILLVPVYGIIGAALSTTIACLVGLVSLTLVYVGKYRPEIDKNDVLKILLSFTIMGFVILNTPHYTRILTLVDVVVSGGVYLAIIMLLGLITKEDLDILFGALPKNRYFQALPEILTNFHRYNLNDPFKNLKNWKDTFKYLNLRSIDEYVPYGLIIFCTSSLKFVEQESLVVLVFIITLFIYIWRKYDSRILVGFAIVLLMLTAVVLATGSESYAENISIIAYYFLVVGVIAQFFEYLREGGGIQETS